MADEEKKEAQEPTPADNTQNAKDEPSGTGKTDEREKPDIKKAHFLSLSSEKKEGAPTSVDFLMDIALELSIELGRAVLNVKDVLSLRDGSVVELDKLAGDPVDILVNDKLIARGEVVVIDDNFGVRVTDILNPSDLINNLGNEKTV